MWGRGGWGKPARGQRAECSGSARSVPGFHLLEALESMRELFIKFGGHSHAADR